MRLEAGRAGDLELDRIRRVLTTLGGRARLTAWYGGAAADRLLDEKHAGIVERALALLVRRGWQVLAEVSYSEYGERGSIDIMAGYEETKALAVCEIKSAIGSLEETNRVLDVKERIAPKLAKQRFGWWPSNVGRLLVVPNEMTVRRTIARHELTMAATYPARSREVRAWLRHPDRPLRAIWFISEVARGDRETP